MAGRTRDLQNAVGIQRISGGEAFHGTPLGRLLQTVKRWPRAPRPSSSPSSPSACSLVAPRTCPCTPFHDQSSEIEVKHCFLTLSIFSNQGSHPNGSKRCGDGEGASQMSKLRRFRAVVDREFRSSARMRTITFMRRHTIGLVVGESLQMATNSCRMG